MEKSTIRYEIRKTYTQELTEEEVRKIEQYRKDNNMQDKGYFETIEKCINEKVITFTENPNDMTDNEQELLWYQLYSKSE